MARGSNNDEWVDSVKPCDVLFGRGSGPNDHEGNVLFRSLVKERKPEYVSTNRQTKAKIAQEIVDAVRARSGRFLKKAEPKDITRLGIPEGVDAWLCVDERTILEKAKQALRQKADSKDRDEASSIPDGTEKDASSDINDELYQVPSATMPHYHRPEGQPMDPPALPDAYVSGDLHVSIPGSQEPLDWRTYGGNEEPLPMYTPPSPRQGQYLQSRCFVGQTYLSEESPPVQRYVDMNPQHQGKDLHQQRLSEEVHRTAAAGYPGDDSPIGDGPGDDARRNSIQVEDLMKSFHRMGTDEMATSSSSNVQQETSSSNDTMGTIEPLPMGASNVSMISSSIASILKGALGESNTPRSSFTRPSCKRENSASSASRNERSGSSDMSLSFSNIDAVFDHTIPGSGRNVMQQVSKVLEGNELEDECSNQPDQKIAADPRPLYLMEEDPDSMNRFGQSSMNILKSMLGDSGDTMGSSAGKMGSDYKKES